MNKHFFVVWCFFGIICDTMFVYLYKTTNVTNKHTYLWIHILCCAAIWPFISVFHIFLNNNNDNSSLHQRSLLLISRRYELRLMTWSWFRNQVLSTNILYTLLENTHNYVYIYSIYTPSHVARIITDIFLLNLIYYVFLTQLEFNEMQ